MLTKLVLALASVAAAAVATTHAEIYFHEDFNDNAWSSRWVASEWKPASEIGAFTHVTGADFTDAFDKAIKTSEDARFYGLSAKFATPLNNKDKALYLSYLVQHEQKLDCGGAYIKLLPADTDLLQFGGSSPYNVMFGPDICGATRKTHAILNYKRPNSKDADGKNMDHNTEIRAEADSDAHVYSFVLKPDNTYDVLIDGTSVKSGALADNWPFQAPKEIEDPAQSKPVDWVDDKMMADPTDKKPAGYDDIPRTIPDPDAVKPEDWDDEDDGEWEAGTIANPEYKGEWQPKLIENPDYKGPWVHPKIPNPDFVEDANMYNVAPNVGAIGFELWQVKSGTLFDDILVTDDADAFAKHEKTVLAKIKANNAKKKAAEDAERAAAEAAAKKKEEEEAVKNAAADGDNDDDDEDDKKTTTATTADKEAVADAIVDDKNVEDKSVDDKDEL